MTAAPRTVERAGQLLHRHIGLRLEPSLRGRLRRAISEAAADAGRDPDAFVDALGGDPAALQALCDRVTVQETGFFRHPEHFDVLARHLLPTLTPPVRIWSAACSNGQEAYSIAMVLAEAGIEGRVIATDVSTAAVRRTRAGHYTSRELGGLSPARLAMHGIRTPGGWTVSPSIRQRVDVALRNLLDPLPVEITSCQVVFCRNVLIYFTPEHATAFVDRLADQLAPGSHLFLGAAESMWQISDRFEPRRFGDTFVYRARSRAGSDRTSARAARPVPGGQRVGPARPDRLSRRADGPSRARPAQRPASAPPARAAGDKTVPLADVVRRGRAALDGGDHATAIQAFRQWAYLAPDDALAHFHLGAALEGSGDDAAAGRAYDISRSLLQRGGESSPVQDFGGYSVADVLRLLESKRGRRR